MEKLISTWSDGKTLPENYVFPPERRPGQYVVPRVYQLLTLERRWELITHKHVVNQIMEAAQQFGFFQVINHGVPRKLMDEARSVFKEFFELPAEKKLKFCSQDYDNKCVYYTSNFVYEKEQLHFWRDGLKHSCNPLQECMQFWPQEPPRYREVAGEYIARVTELGSKLLELICEGLGLEHNYFEIKGLSQEQMLITYIYPPCPDPSLTWGAVKHNDPNLLTLLLQDKVPGLQVLKDGEWVCVEPNPDAFVINICDQLQIVSNGKLRSVEHRVVTNEREARTSAAFFISPTKECLVEPAKAFITAENPPLYKGVKYEDFFKKFKATYRDKSDQSVVENYLS